MYIYAYSNYTDMATTDVLSNKKVLLGKKFNRTDNFTDLTLLGAQECVDDIHIDKQSSVYLASENGNLNTTFKVMDSIFVKKQLPMPFNFLNTVNAATLFYVAKCFNIEGKTIFTDRFDSAFPQAVVDVKQGKTALLGVVSETIENLELRNKRFGDIEMEESSRWLLLSSELNGIDPIARIYDFRLTSATEADDSVEDLFAFLENGDGVFEFQGNNLFFKIEKVL